MKMREKDAKVNTEKVSLASNADKKLDGHNIESSGEKMFAVDAAGPDVCCCVRFLWQIFLKVGKFIIALIEKVFGELNFDFSNIFFNDYELCKKNLIKKLTLHSAFIEIKPKPIINHFFRCLINTLRVKPQNLRLNVTPFAIFEP